MMMVMPLVIARQNEEEEEEEENYRRRVVGPEALPCFVLMCLRTGGSSLSDRHWKNKGPTPSPMQKLAQFFFQVYSQAPLPIVI